MSGHKLEREKGRFGEGKILHMYIVVLQLTETLDRHYSL